MPFEMNENEDRKIEMRIKVSKHTQQFFTKLKEQYEVKTYSAAIERMCVEYEKLQKEITIAHTLDDVLRALSLLETSITEQIKQASRISREARNHTALCLMLLNDMQFESKNKYHYDVDSPRLSDARKDLDSILSKARSYKQENTDRQSWTTVTSENGEKSQT